MKNLTTSIQELFLVNISFYNMEKLLIYQKTNNYFLQKIMQETLNLSREFICNYDYLKETSKLTFKLNETQMCMFSDIIDIKTNNNIINNI